MKNHIELMFHKFDFALIEKILEAIRVGVQEDAFEVAQSATSSLDYFNEFVFNS
jgi:hypothetical protein